jgi:hypothetical protein
MLMTFCYEGKWGRLDKWHGDENWIQFFSANLITNRLGDLGKDVRQCPL